ncbi:MAG: PEF-CTERM sorting domain-containing protein [Candidatus Methanoperedens sp.]|nr:PEF-CTERM sorting domain-containing protein [Candidatus Methanoperedens sp.]
MKNKIITITAFLAVMVAMTGIAAAIPYDAFIYNAAGTSAAPQPVSLKPGDSVILSYRGENIIPAAFGVPLPYSSTVVALGGGGVASDITVTLPVSFTPTAATSTDVGAINIALSSSAPVGASYRVTIKGGDEAVDVDFGAASRNISSIPEFPTVALPVAAAIGLVFFFQHRKRKEE